MTAHELFDRIETWNKLYIQIPIPHSSDPLFEISKEQVDRTWDNGMLKNASELEMIPELHGTPVESDLRTAIEIAKTFDRTKLKDIRECLLNVQKYMYLKGLT